MLFGLTDWLNYYFLKLIIDTMFIENMLDTLRTMLWFIYSYNFLFLLFCVMVFYSFFMYLL